MQHGAEALVSGLESRVSPPAEALDTFAAAMQALRAYASACGSASAAECGTLIAACLRRFVCKCFGSAFSVRALCACLLHFPHDRHPLTQGTVDVDHVCGQHLLFCMSWHAPQSSDAVSFRSASCSRLLVLLCRGEYQSCIISRTIAALRWT